MRMGLFTPSLALLAGIVSPSTAHAAPPGELRSLQDALRETSAVVEGDVSDISFNYDQQNGPRTLVRLTVTATQWGQFKDPSVALSTLGAPMPTNKFFDIPALPHFVS